MNSTRITTRYENIIIGWHGGEIIVKIRGWGGGLDHESDENDPKAGKVGTFPKELPSEMMNIPANLRED